MSCLFMLHKNTRRANKLLSNLPLDWTPSEKNTRVTQRLNCSNKESAHFLEF
jgi:hypothetical protein